MKERKKIYKLDDAGLDSLLRFVKSNNVFSYIINSAINVVLFVFRTIKKIIHIFKPSQPILIDESKSISEKTQTTNIYDFKTYKQIINIQKNKKYIIFIDLQKDSNDTSGALDYSDNKIVDLESNYKAKSIKLCYKRFTDAWFIEFSEMKEVTFSLSSFDEIKYFFEKKEIKCVFINNLVFQNDIEKIIDGICSLKQNYNFKLECAFHDYLSICPSNFLIDYEGEPCNRRNCESCIIKNNYRSIVRNDIKKWRDKYNLLFKYLDKAIFFSEFSKNIILEIYPSLEDKYSIIPHKLLISESASEYKKRKYNDSINIAFVGYFHHIKGSHYFIELVKKLKKEMKINATIVGYLESGKEEEIKNYCNVTGKYNRNDLGKILTKNGIDLVIYPSINSETYSYIIQELMFLKVPIVVFRRGAPAERIEKEKYTMAEIADDLSLESLYKATKKLIKRIKENEKN